MELVEYLLDVVAEECNETAIRCSKALRFSLTERQPGQDYTNAERILHEFNDLVAAMEMLQEHGVFPDTGKTVFGLIDPVLVANKKAKVLKLMDLSVQTGALLPRSHV